MQMTTPREQTPEQAERFARLEKAVAEHRDKLVRGVQQERDAIKLALETEPRDLAATAKEIAAKLGVLPLGAEPDNLDAIDAECLEFRKKKARELEEAQLRGRFNHLCPPAFRVPWDWSKAKPEVSREEVCKVFGWQYGPRGLYVAGPTGHSKTRAVCILMRRLLLKERRTVEFWDGVAFSRLCTKNFSGNDEKGDLLLPLVNADVLIIDDLAKRWTSATEEGAFDVLNRRTGRDRPTIVTLNYSTDELFSMQQARGELAAMRDLVGPLIRRLCDFCEPVVL